MVVKQYLKHGVMIVAAAFLLNGCGHKNPMLNKDSVAAYGSYYPFAAPDDFPTYAQDCFDYFAGQKTIPASLQKHCDAQLKKDYAGLQKNRRNDILKGGTFEDFKDPRFWKAFRNNEY